jgi:hypothetical protein
MPKKGNKRIAASLKSFGRYERWSGRTKDVPQVVDFTEVIPSRVDVEFGYVLQISGGHGEVLRWEIDHPPWRDERGRPVAAFRGEFHVRGNTFAFFLGETVWEPLGEKCGVWTLSTWHGERLLAQERFQVLAEDASAE